MLAMDFLRAAEAPAPISIMAMTARHADDDPQGGQHGPHGIAAQGPKGDAGGGVDSHGVPPGRFRAWSGRGGVIQNHPVVHADYPLGVSGHLGVVGHHDDGDAVLGIELLEHLEHLFAGPRIQVAGGLVGKEHRRVVDQRSGDGDPLLLTAGELRGLVVQPVGQPHPAKHLRGPPSGLTVTQVFGGIRKRHGHVLDGAGPGQQIETLEDKSQFTVAHQGPLVGGELGDLLSLQPVLAGGWSVQAAQDVHQRGFSGSGRTGESDQLPLPDGQGDAFEHRHGDVAHLVGLYDVVQVDEVHGSIQLSVCRDVCLGGRGCRPLFCHCRSPAGVSR